MSIFALTSTVHELPNDTDSITVKKFEDIYSNKEENKVLRVLSVNNKETNEDAIETTHIKIWDSITLAGDMEAVIEASAEI